MTASMGKRYHRNPVTARPGTACRRVVTGAGTRRLFGRGADPQVTHVLGWHAGRPGVLRGANWGARSVLEAGAMEYRSPERGAAAWPDEITGLAGSIQPPGRSFEAAAARVSRAR